MVGQLPFVPQPSERCRVIDVREDVKPSVYLALSQAIKAFTDGADDLEFFQLPTMGRACARWIPPANQSVLVIKGDVGHGPAYDLHLEHAAMRWRSLFGDRAGRAGLSFSSGNTERREYSIELDFRPHPDKPGHLQIFSNPGIGAYTPFEQLLQEYVTSRTVYEPLGIRAPTAVALLRRHDEAPWAAMSPADLKRRVAERVQGVIRETLPADEAGRWPVEFGEELQLPRDLDSGLLFRRFRSPHRPQQLYDQAMRGEWGQLYRSFDIMGEYPNQAWSRRFVGWMANSAGDLTRHGVIHGMLCYAYQNVTTAGEICDFDNTVVAPSVNPRLAETLTVALRADQETHDTPVIAERYRSRLDTLAPNHEVAARTLMEQSYYLWNAALRFADLSRRAEVASTDPQCASRPGTILTADEVTSLHRQFARQLASRLDEKARDMVALCRGRRLDPDTGFRIIGGGSLLGPDEHGWANILGWSNPDQDFNHYKHRRNSSDVDYIVRHFESFSGVLCEELGIETARRPVPATRPRTSRVGPSRKR